MTNQIQKRARLTTAAEAKQASGFRLLLEAVLQSMRHQSVPSAFSCLPALDTLAAIRKSSGVFRKLGHVLLIVALIATVGGHWIVLQSVAWTNMLAENLRTASMTEALGKTFDGRHPCCLCKAINEGKKSEKKSELPAPLKKIEFVSEQPVFVFNPPQDFCLMTPRTCLLDNLSSEPPIPPPRQLPG